ncbi:MAG: diacylglycerol kinase family protein [Anaerolineae bacterium]
MNVHVIQNPMAGHAGATGDIEAALRLLRDSGWRLTVHETQAPGDTTRLAATAALEGADAVVTIGGDGSLSEAANGLAGTDTALGLIPMGTGNVWAAQLGLIQVPTLIHRPDPISAARALVSSQRKDIDLGVASSGGYEKYFMLWAGIGLDAAITQVIETEAKPVKRRFGQVAYIYAAVRPVLEARGTRVKLRIDGKPHRHRVMFMVVTNIQYYAGTYLAPEAQADDGLFDVFLFDGDSWVDTLRHVAQIALRRHQEDPTVETFRAREVEILADESLAVHLDGDPFVRTPLRIRVAPRALTVLLPASAPVDLFSDTVPASRPA